MPGPDLLLLQPSSAPQGSATLVAPVLRTERCWWVMLMGGTRLHSELQGMGSFSTSLRAELALPGQ